MNTTLKQMTLPTPKGEEVLDMTEFATNESVVNGLASLESKVDTESQAIQAKIDAIPSTDLSEVAKESTLNAVSKKLDNLNVDVDLSSVAQQGDNKEATNSKILEVVIAIENRSARYDSTTGNLTIENVNLVIE